jgi:hypothetical protein
MEFIIKETMENVEDLWVGLLLPHEAKNYTKLVEKARAVGLNGKDRKMVKITKEMLPILNYKLQNPLSQDVLDYLLNTEQECLAICWIKSNYIDSRPFEEVVPDLYNTIMNPPPPPTPEELSEEGSKSSRISVGSEQNLRTLVVVIQPEEDPDDFPFKRTKSVMFANRGSQDSKKSQVEKLPTTSVDQDPTVTAENQGLVTRKEEDLEMIQRAAEEELKDQDTYEEDYELPEGAYQIEIPPLWTPFNREANALFLYVFFRKVWFPLNFYKFLFNYFSHRFPNISFQMTQSQSTNTLS